MAPGEPIPSHFVRDCVIAGACIGVLLGLLLSSAWVVAHILVVMVSHLRPG